MGDGPDGSKHDGDFEYQRVKAPSVLNPVTFLFFCILLYFCNYDAPCIPSRTLETSASELLLNVDASRKWPHFLFTTTPFVDKLECVGLTRVGKVIRSELVRQILGSCSIRTED